MALIARLLPARASRARARSAAGSTFEQLERGFIHTLVPIAAVYVAAHYLTFLVFEGQAIIYLASDPFGQGWDLFGTANSGDRLRPLPAGGHLVRAGRGSSWSATSRRSMLAHDRALTLYGDAQARRALAVLDAGVMVGFTSLALWLLAQAGIRRVYAPRAPVTPSRVTRHGGDRRHSGAGRDRLAAGGRWRDRAGDRRHGRRDDRDGGDVLPRARAPQRAREAAPAARAVLRARGGAAAVVRAAPRHPLRRAADRGVRHVLGHLDCTSTTGRDPGPFANAAHYFILVGLFGIFFAGLLSRSSCRPRSPARPRSGCPADWQAPLGGVLILVCVGRRAGRLPARRHLAPHLRPGRDAVGADPPAAVRRRVALHARRR